MRILMSLAMAAVVIGTLSAQAATKTMSSSTSVETKCSGAGCVQAHNNTWWNSYDTRYETELYTTPYLSMDMARSQNIVQVTSQSPSFDILTRALKETGLDKMLSSGEYTLFAPTDDAFRQLPQQTLDALFAPSNRNELKRILSYHVVPKKSLSMDDITDMHGVESAEGANLDIETRGPIVMIDSARIVQSDIQTSNGTIQVIDKVLVPGENNLYSWVRNVIQAPGAVVKGVTNTTMDVVRGAADITERAVEGTVDTTHDGVNRVLPR